MREVRKLAEKVLAFAEETTKMLDQHRETLELHEKRLDSLSEILVGMMAKE